MSKQDEGFDYHRYQDLLAEAVDEPSRLALIDLLIEERARERLKARQHLRAACDHGEDRCQHSRHVKDLTCTGAVG